MKFSLIREHDGTHKFMGELRPEDLITMRLGRFDRALLDDCGKSNKASDLLLALEMLYRRYEEQAARQNIG